jgi:hypothetical protein
MRTAAEAIALPTLATLFAGAMEMQGMHCRWSSEQLNITMPRLLRAAREARPVLRRTHAHAWLSTSAGSARTAVSIAKGGCKGGMGLA